MTTATELTFAVGGRPGEVSGLLLRPGGARLVYVLAHGAGAGMRHPFLETVAQRLAERDIADLKLLRPVVKRLGERATLHLVDGGDHSFHVLKRSGRVEADVMGELVGAIAEWTAGIV